MNLPHAPLSFVETVLRARRGLPGNRALLVAITGIDGCGKGYVAARIAGALGRHGVRTATINIDGWLALPSRRFDAARPAEHFYHHAIRFDEMFSRLVLPLRDNRSLRLESDFTEETATAYRRATWAFEDIDVILLEGIYLLKRAYRARYDLSLWIDCTFQTALERAIARAQEGLSPEETVRAYQTLYFPAQEIHIARDAPGEAAGWRFVNDPRSGPVDWARLLGAEEEPESRRPHDPAAGRRPDRFERAASRYQ